VWEMKGGRRVGPVVVVVVVEDDGRGCQGSC
jgi:hypothetical protein